MSRALAAVPALAPARDLDETASMALGLASFVGRMAELELLRGALGDARDDRGSTWLLAGEAGIGKSRLVEEIARVAAASGFATLWGRCWEAGGAPAFWPWIQIVREGLRIAEAAMLDGGRAAHLAQLVPEVGADAAGAPPPGDGARFMLLDSVANGLVAASRARPLLVVLEDLHVATPSSLLMLDFIAQQVRGAPLLILGTYRDTEVHSPEAATILQRIAQAHHTIALPRLGREAIAEFLVGATGDRKAAALADSVAERTEGNPLFLVELGRLIVARGTVGEVPTDAIPPTLRSALQRHVAALSPAAHAILEQAAVIGRDFGAAPLAGAFGLRSEDATAAIDEAERAAIVARTSEGTYRFAHILLREVLHQEISPAPRQQLHLQVARWLETYGVDHSALPWSEIAHHYLLAGDDGRECAIDANERAAQQATASLAFAEAIALYRTALEAVDLTPGRNPRRRAELMIGLGHAQLHGGDARTGRDTCLAAAALARELGAPELLARAALELGSVLTFANVDPMLVALLEEALRALATGHDRLRARVMARLAAAKQPALDPTEPIALALEAVQLARTTGDRATLLAALSCASSAMIDNVGAVERVPIDREHVTLAAVLDEPVEQLRGQVRLAFGTFELGDLTAAHAAVARVGKLGARLRHPFYASRATAMDATIALWEGRFAEAEMLIGRARQLGAAGGDPNVTPTVTYQTAWLARLTGRRDLLRETTVRLCQLFSSNRISETLSRIYAAALQLQFAPTSPVTLVTGADLDLIKHDRSCIASAAEVAVAMTERPFAARLLAMIATERSRCLTTGVIGMTWDGPITRSRALLEYLLGQHDTAIASMTEAIATARDLGGRPIVAWTSVELAGWLAIRDRTGDRAAAQTLLDEAAAIARELGMASVTERIASARNRALSTSVPAPIDRSKPAADAEPLELTRSGDVWTLARGTRRFQLRDSKGLRYLARLVAEPRRELHALDLADALDGVDAGDAGELLDPKARESYRVRLRELEETLAEAEGRNDIGAVERATRELDFLQAELARAVGLGGRSRRAGNAAERARINVQRRIRTAITQIGSHDEAIARHLERSVKTGVFCSYEPE